MSCRQTFSREDHEGEMVEESRKWNWVDSHSQRIAVNVQVEASVEWCLPEVFLAVSALHHLYQ